MTQGRAMAKIALLSNVTVDLLAEKLGKQFDVYLPNGYDAWQQDIFTDTSGLYGTRPDAVVVLLYADAYADGWRTAEKGEGILGEWGSAVCALADHMPGVPVFVSTIDIHSVRCRYGAETNLDKYFENRWMKMIQDLFRDGKKTYLLPVKELVEEIGRKNFYYPKMWYMGGMPYSMKAIAALAELIGRYVSVIKGTGRKCLAVDLDNTLWGGTAGEDGVQGIVLSDSKEGARYKDTQRYLKKMKEQGVMLAVLSKNNVEDVEAVFLHPDMVLRHDDFVAEAVNWNAKPENLRAMVERLNIGLDAFVFLDDNPAEREQMRVECPEVAVLDFPEDTSRLPETVAEAYDKYFLSLEVTGEDVQKTAMYRSEARRETERKSAPSVEGFLRNLEMRLDIHLMTEAEETRTVQLINKTNQFNLTTVRYSAEEVRRLAEGEDSDVITVHMSDKYGSQGLSAVVIVRVEGRTAEIDTFLMSCRVMGRSAEDTIMALTCEWLAQKGIEDVKGSYVRTVKNSPVENLYDRLGFEVTGMCGEEGSIGWRKDYRIWTNRVLEPPDVFCSIRKFGREEE